MDWDNEEVIAIQQQLTVIIKSWKHVQMVKENDNLTLLVRKNEELRPFLYFKDQWMEFPFFPVEDKLISTILPRIERHENEYHGDIWRLSLVDIDFTALIPLAEQAYRHHLLS